MLGPQNSPKFVCLQYAKMLGIDDEGDDGIFFHAERKRLHDLSGDTEEEVRRKLNKYLLSKEAFKEYGGRLSLMEEGMISTEGERTERNFFAWMWRFEIVPFSKDHLREEPKTPDPAFLPVDE